MIERTNAFKVGGQSFLTLIDAQKYELLNLEGLQEVNSSSDVTEFILKNKDVIIDILTTKITSKPKARRINGGTKKRVIISDSQSI